MAGDQTHQKGEKLISWLQENSPLVAFSGGVDSTFLAFLASRHSEDYLAVTVSSPLCPSWEIEEAPGLARELGLKHQTIFMDVLADEKIASNPEDRCYHCKKAILKELSRIAAAKGLVPVDGTNADDLGAHRPGRRALSELSVGSPLAEAGLSKTELRLLSREMGLPTWDKEPMPCLATRVPYGQKLTPPRLERIDRAEAYLRSKGFKVVRLRDHGDLARIELGREDLDRLDLGSLRKDVAERLRELGYRYVTLDLSGYRSGSWDRK